MYIHLVEKKPLSPASSVEAHQEARKAAVIGPAWTIIVTLMHMLKMSRAHSPCILQCAYQHTAAVYMFQGGSRIA